MNDLAVERARGMAYTLLGRWLSGVTDAASWREMQRLFWPDPTAAFDADDEAARYQRFIGFNVLPYASVYLEADGQLGGEVSRGVLRHYADAGFTPPADAPAPDHVSAELGFLAYLTHGLVGAMEQEPGVAAERWQEALRRFIDAHALCWMPAFVLALRRQGDERYGILADTLLELVLDHREALGGAAVPAPEGSAGPDLLAKPETGWKEIAGFLVRPAWSGLFLARDDISRMGRAVSSPIGFGDRTQMLVNLMRSAVSYERMDDLLGMMRMMVEGAALAYTAMSDAYASPAIEAAAEPWLRRLSATERMLGDLQEGVHRLAPDDDAH